MARKKDGTFGKGQSGNLAGRPKSEISLATLKSCKARFVAMAADKIDDWGPDIIRKAIEMARAGDQKMIILLFDKFFDMKDSSKLGEMIFSSTAKQIANSEDIIIARAAAGEIDVGYALDMMKALSIKRESIIVRDLEQYVNIQKSKESRV